jgi:hypothetical protein
MSPLDKPNKILRLCQRPSPCYGRWHGWRNFVWLLAVAIWFWKQWKNAVHIANLLGTQTVKTVSTAATAGEIAQTISAKPNIGANVCRREAFI